MRRKIIAITALVCLVAAGAAYGATQLNHYKANYSFKGHAGSRKHPAAVSMTLNYTAANAKRGDRAWPLIDIKSSTKGIRSNARYWPTCSMKAISTAPKYNGNCPRGSLVGVGSVVSSLGSQTNMANSAGISCKLKLVVYNSGHGKLTYFFIVVHSGDCGPFVTGAAAPYTGRLTESHGSLIENVPLPPDVSTMAGGQPLYASLMKEHLTFLKHTRKVHGKRVGFLESTGCVRHRHNWWVRFTATNGHQKQTKMVRGKAKC